VCKWGYSNDFLPKFAHKLFFEIINITIGFRMFSHCISEDNRINLTPIKGISYFFNTPETGTKLTTKGIKKALLVIELFSNNNLLSNYSIDHVDISDRNNIVFSVNGVIIKMGTDNFSSKINKLVKILDDPKINIDEISYMDMRFDDPVISPK